MRALAFKDGGFDGRARPVAVVGAAEGKGRGAEGEGGAEGGLGLDGEGEGWGSAFVRFWGVVVAVGGRGAFEGVEVFGRGLDDGDGGAGRIAEFGTFGAKAGVVETCLEGTARFAALGVWLLGWCWWGRARIVVVARA